MPLWVLPLFSYWIFATNKPIIAQTIALASEGELFVYSAASLGPLVYMTVRRYGEWNANDRFPLTISFPSGNSFLVFSLLVCIVSGLAFGVVRIPELRSSDLPLNQSGTITLGIAMFVSSLICLFCASSYRNSIDDFVRSTTVNDDEEFSSKWRVARDARRV
jgi:hypothetical protein